MPINDSSPETLQSAPPPQAANEELPPQRLEIHIPWTTFIKVFVALLTAYAVYQPDAVFILAYALNPLPCIRNLMLAYRESRNRPAATESSQ